MLRRIKDGNQLFWMIFHAILGIAAGLSHDIITGWVYIIVGSTLVTFLNAKHHNDILHYFFVYYLPFEVFARMLKLSPYIPIESGKYISAFFLILAIIARCRNTDRYKVNTVGLAICVLSIPSIAFVKEDEFLDAIVFNWLGIFDLGLFAIYFSNYVFSKKEVIDLFRLMVYPVITMTFFLFFNTPSISELKFDIGANHAASGHFGPNQVSSIYGIGIFILGIALILNYQVYKNYIVELGLVLVFFVRGVLTFSRGGVFSAMLALMVIFFWGRAKSIKWSPKKVATVLIMGVLGFMIFSYINEISGNTLLDRYSGDTAATSQGNRERDLRTITDGRSVIIEAELGLFLEHPLLGVGPGQSRYNWDINNDIGQGAGSDDSIASHTEFTRLLAEHGMLGLIICFLLILPCIKYWVYRRDLMRRGFAYYLNIAFLVFALTMCTHSAMRTMVTPLFYGLAFAGMRTLQRKIPSVGPRQVSSQPQALTV